MKTTLPTHEELITAERDKLREQVKTLLLALKKLRSEIEPMAAQIICPKDNTFTRQLAVIESSILEVEGSK